MVIFPKSGCKKHTGTVWQDNYFSSKNVKHLLVPASEMYGFTSFLCLLWQWMRSLCVLDCWLDKIIWRHHNGLWELIPSIPESCHAPRTHHVSKWQRAYAPKHQTTDELSVMCIPCVYSTHPHHAHLQPLHHHHPTGQPVYCFLPILYFLIKRVSIWSFSQAERVYVCVCVCVCMCVIIIE